jgi:SAM-dependent methyltransferase
MDLHDYADVAQNYDHFLPEVVNDAYLKGFEEFHLSLAEKYGKDGVLDIACGTGALTIPLVKAGYDVTALDLSAPMVEVTQDKLQVEGLKTDVFVANMTDFQIPRKFSLAIIARSGFMHLLTAGEQRQTLMNIREHLTDGGALTFNHFQPFPIIQAEQMKAAPDEYFLRSEYINHEGKRERIYNAVTYDHIKQVQAGSLKFETLDDDGNLTDSRIRPWAMRHTYRQEMEYLFELCGYEIVGVYDNYCYDEARGMLIWVVRKK